MKKKYIFEYLFVSIILLFFEFFFFRNVIATSGLIGDYGDSRLCTLLTEHWYRFFSGTESFSSIRMFYPMENVIGYSDMLLGYGIIHSLFRLFGVDMYTSYKMTLIVVHVIGSVFMYLLLRRQLNLDLGWSTLGVITFSYSIQYSIRVRHTQLSAISFLPVILYFALLYWHNRENKKRIFYGGIAVTIFVLLMYTAWYMAFFSVIFCMLWGFCLLTGVLVRRLWDWSVLKKNIAFYWKEAVGYLLYALILLIPFMLIYLPQMKASGSQKWDNVIDWLPRFKDYLNVTEDSLVFSGLMDKISFQSNYETEIGYVIPFLLLFIIVLVFMLLRRRNVILTSMAVATLIAALLIVKWGESNFSLWYVVYLLMPGAGSIRAVARFAFFLSLPASIAIAVEGNQWTYEGDKNIRYGFVMSLVCLVFWWCNICKMGVGAYWDADAQIQFVNSVAAPPQECEVFYIKSSAGAQKPPFAYQLDAFELATAFEKKTINGYSGQFPDDWWGLWDVGIDAYEQNAISWAEQHGISHLYSYDLTTNEWKEMY